MNKAILVLTLLCGFLLGVVAGPWIQPQNPGASPEAASEAAPAPATPPIAELPLPPTAPVALPEPAMGSGPAEPEMQLKGVFLVGDGSRSVALIQTDGGQPQPYRVEQKLPNGYVVKTIARNMVEVEKNGNNVSLPLVRASNSATPETTTEAEAAPAPEDAQVIEPTVEDAPVATEPAPAEPGRES